MRYHRNFNCGMRDKNSSAGAGFAHADGRDAGGWQQYAGWKTENHSLWPRTTALTRPIWIITNKAEGTCTKGLLIGTKIESLWRDVEAKMASSHDRTCPRDLLQDLVAGTRRPIVCTGSVNRNWRRKHIYISLIFLFHGFTYNSLSCTLHLQCW